MEGPKRTRVIDESEYDRKDWHPDNGKGGETYYGKDDGEGHTDWYDSNGNLDCTTDTPDDDDEYQCRI